MRLGITLIGFLGGANIAAAQITIRPYLVGGIAELKAARHGYQDVSQHGWITGYGGGGGVALTWPGGLGMDLSLEHHRSGSTVVYDANLLPTDERQPAATHSAIALEARFDPRAAPIGFRLGGVVARHGGDVALGRNGWRSGVRGGITVHLARGAVRPGFQLTATRYLNGEAGIGWVVGPGFRLDF